MGGDDLEQPGPESGSEGEDTAGAPGAKGGAGGGDQSGSPAFDKDLIEGVSLQDLDAKGRAIIEARLKVITANNTRKRMTESKTVRQAQENLHLLDQLTSLTKDPRVAAAMEQALQGPAPQSGSPAREEGEDDLPLSEDPKENLKRFKEAAKREAKAELQKDFDARFRELETKLGRSVAPLHDRQMEAEWEKVVADYPDTDYPEVHVAKDEIFAFAKQTGLPLAKAVLAHQGDVILPRIREKEKKMAGRKAKSEDLAESPFPNLQKLLTTGKRKPFRSSAEAAAWFEEHGYPKGTGGSNGKREVGAGRE